MQLNEEKNSMQLVRENLYEQAVNKRMPSGNIYMCDPIYEIIG